MATIDPTLETSSRSDEWEARIFLATRVLVILCFVIALVSTYFITQEWDEAIIYGTLKQGLAGSEQPLGLRVPITSGGLHSLAQAFSYFLFGPDLFFVRILSLGYLVILLRTLSTLFDLPRQPREGRLLLVATVLAVPGLFFHSILAFSCVLATAVFLMTLIVWQRFPCSSQKRRVYTGLLLGLVIATRFNFLLALPLFCIDFTGKEPRQYLRDGIAIGAVASATFLLCSVGLLLATHSPLEQALYDVSLSIGIWNRSPQEWGQAFQGEGFSLMSLIRPGTWLNRWKMANQIFPLSIMAISTAYAWLPLSGRTARDTSIMRLVIVFSWLGWFAWIVITPMPYLRYLLPSLIGFAIVLGHLTVELYLAIKEHQRPAAIIIPIFVLAGLANSTVMSARQLYIGESRRIVSEFGGGWGPTAGIEKPPLVAANEERQLANYVRENLDDRQTIAVHIKEYYQLIFASGKEMKTLGEATKEKERPQWIIVERNLIDPQFEKYFRDSHFRLVEFDSYVIYERRKQ